MPVSCSVSVVGFCYKVHGDSCVMYSTVYSVWIVGPCHSGPGQAILHRNIGPAITGSAGLAGPLVWIIGPWSRVSNVRQLMFPSTVVY